MDYRKRYLEQRVLSAGKAFKVVMLLGARQVGKSTCYAHLFPDSEMFVFDSILDPYQVKTDPDLFLDLHAPPLLLDEVQFAPLLLSAIKRRVDRQENRGQYYLTGSQNLTVLKTVSETMTGRVALLHMEGMSLHERANLANEENWLMRYLKDPEQFLKTPCQIIPLVAPLHEAVWRGSLPGVLETSASEVPLYFKSYIQTYVERDLRLVEKIEDLDRFGAFLLLLGALSGKEINYSQLGREVGISPKTAQRWLFSLVASYQWREILPLYPNPIRRISERRKGVFTDSGIASHLMRLSTPEDLATHPSLGALFETWVINHIHQLFSSLSMAPTVYHWRTHGGAEIDLVLELGGTYFPIEIKCSRNLSGHDLRSFSSFRSVFSDKRVAPGLIIHAGEESYLLDRRTLALSWKAL